MLLLLLLFFAVVTCTTVPGPNCTWACDDPHCPAVCTPLCLAPVCEVTCNSTQVCAAASCNIQCQESQDPTSACPVCETVCAAPSCAPTAVGCQNLCEAPNCTWSCRAPTNCPHPVCQLQCEQAFCASFGSVLIPSFAMLFLALTLVTM